jgi:hypothetical protein
MLNWTVAKLANGNDYWFAKTSEKPGNDFIIYQELLDNHIMYTLYRPGCPSEKFETLQEAKQACEPVEKPFEVGHFEERKWGNFTVLEKGDGYLIKKLFIKKGRSISYQYHEHRSEEWIILKGLGDFKTQLPRFNNFTGYTTQYYSFTDGALKSLGDITKLANIVTRYGSGAYLQINKKQYHKWTSVEDTEILEVWRGQDLRESDIIRLDT